MRKNESNDKIGKILKKLALVGMVWACGEKRGRRVMGIEGHGKRRRGRVKTMSLGSVRAEGTLGGGGGHDGVACRRISSHIVPE